KVLISAKVGPNGEVSSADVASNTGLSPTVASCIAGVVKRATFSAPGGGGSTLQIPVTFVQQGKEYSPARGTERALRRPFCFCGFLAAFRMNVRARATKG